jgi:ADP-ribosylglycohydrolase
MNRKEHIQGMFLGGVIGDAVGAVLEFNYRKMTENIIRNAMKMPGGGVYSVGEGQPTDDSELSFSLLQVLLEHDPSNGFPRDKVQEAYHNWYKSNPFDCGYTCRLAFSSKDHNVRLMSYVADSQANGALMRVSPISIWAIINIWGMDCPDELIAHFARQDALLSHPNKVCQDCNAIYCIALTYLIKHPSKNIDCINHIRQYIEENKNTIHTDVQKWFHDSQSDELPNDFNAEKQIGWVRWAFTLSFHFLMKGNSFETTLYDVISYGGDVDTNACIVMTMMGALHGIKGIPEYYKNKVLSFDCVSTDNGQKRPVEYSTPVVYEKLLKWLEKQ